MSWQQPAVGEGRRRREVVSRGGTDDGADDGVVDGPTMEWRLEYYRARTGSVGGGSE